MTPSNAPHKLRGAGDHLGGALWSRCVSIALHRAAVEVHRGGGGREVENSPVSGRSYRNIRGTWERWERWERWAPARRGRLPGQGPPFSTPSVARVLVLKSQIG
jgi:hypothetical protein